MVAPIPDTDYRIKLQVFEGPLDLLLFLIRKNELDIYDIPIEQVTKQYLDVLFAMGELKLELAGEFFVMAATLMEIKSRMLLPKHQQAIDPNAEDEELVDPRWELVHQLVQYKKFKDAAGGIAEMISTRQSMLERPSANLVTTEGERPLRPSDRIELWNAFNQVLRRLAEKLVVGDIADDQVTVVDQMEMILKRIVTEPRFVFTSLLPPRVSLRTLVSTFLAVLELTRMRKLRVMQDEVFADIIVEAVGETSAAAPTAENPAVVAPAETESPAPVAVTPPTAGSVAAESSAVESAPPLTPPLAETSLTASGEVAAGTDRADLTPATTAASQEAAAEVASSPTAASDAPPPAASAPTSEPPVSPS